MTETLRLEAQQLEGQWINGEYHLRHFLGGSAFSADLSIGDERREPRSVVIKLAEENSPEADLRSESWRIALGISHPDLLRLFQVGRCRIGNLTFAFAVLEQADEVLSQVLPYRPLTEAETISLLDTVLNALAYLHANGLVHGHIKPANVMACGEMVKLSSDGVTRSGKAIGDRSGYDPPEMTTSPAGDAWSLGMTLVEILTQRLPLWDKNLEGDPVVPRSLPAPFFAIVRNCLRRDPRKRWTIRDIARHLHRVDAASLASKPIVSAAARRVLYVVLAILLVAGAVVGVKVLNRTRKARSDQPSAAAVGSPAESTLPKSPPAESTQPSNSQAELAKPQQSATGDDTNSGSAPEEPIAAKPAQPTTPPSETTKDSVIHEVIPDVPQKARATIWGTVRVGIRVTVEPSGDVSEAIIVSPGPSQYFADLAQQAAQKWKFAATPGHSDIWILRFEFSATDTQVSSAHATQ